MDSDQYSNRSAKKRTAKNEKEAEQEQRIVLLCLADDGLGFVATHTDTDTRYHVMVFAFSLHFCARLSFTHKLVSFASFLCSSSIALFLLPLLAGGV